MEYIKVGSLFWIIQAIPESVTGDTVTIEIRRLSDGYTWNFLTLAFTAPATTGSMTFVNGITWKASFTPPTADTYIVTVHDETLDVKYSQTLNATGQAAAAGLTGSELTTLANLRTFLKKQTADTADDTLLENIISRVSADVEKRCGRSFIAATVTEYYEGNGKAEMLVRRPPINSITSIHIDADRTWTSDMAIDSDNIIISEECPGLIILDGDIFDKGLGIENVRVIYNGGYTTIPADLESKVLRLCAWDYLEASRWNNAVVKGEKNIDELRDAVWKEIINNYKLRVF